MISRSHGNVIKSHGILLIFHLSATKHFCGVNPRDADDRDLKLVPNSARMTIASSYVCINTPISSQKRAPIGLLARTMAPLSDDSTSSGANLR